jgi:16S rRNA (uracil1498-N3)-methyltransferase
MSTDGARRRSACVAQAFVDNLVNPLLDDADAHHLLKVRRLRDGEMIVVADGSGAWRTCVIKEGALEAVSEIEIEPELEDFGVAMAAVKGDRSEWAVAKLTELGATRIVALATDHAAVRWDGHATTKVLDRWRRVSIEAACQSRQVRLPRIEGPVRLVDLSDQGVAMANLGGKTLTADVNLVAVGPESGWSEAELGLGLDQVELAGGVLRTETAAVAAGTLLGWLRGGTVPSEDQ